MVTDTAGGSGDHPVIPPSSNSHELATLLNIAATVASTLELEPLLGVVLDQLKMVVDYAGGAIYTVEPTGLRMLGLRTPTMRQPEVIADARLPLEQVDKVWSCIQRHEWVIITDTRRVPALRAAYARLGEQVAANFHNIRSWLGMPMVVRDRLIGVLTLSHGGVDFFTPHHARLVRAVADQAAIAVENARLIAEAHERTVLEERQRLARDLHDAVTQMLFSASLIGDVLPRLWERDPERARRSLEDLRLLTRGALAEMRMLLLELRPAALQAGSLGDLLRHLVDAAGGHNLLPVRLHVDEQAPVPEDVRVNVYRVVQEALNNARKHARATEVSIRVAASPERVELVVKDNGRGFVQQMVSADHHGLAIMHERAASIGASLCVWSRPERGTIVQLVWENGATTSRALRSEDATP
jgi:signal transduction histidine kinase